MDREIVELDDVNSMDGVTRTWTPPRSAASVAPAHRGTERGRSRLLLLGSDRRVLQCDRGLGVGCPTGFFRAPPAFMENSVEE
jgi:hypothetical protein